MTLNQQLLIVSILPLSFLLMALFTWRSKTRRRFVYGRWLGTLLLAAVWASSTVRFFFPLETVSAIVRFNWGVIGTYAFTLTMIGTLFTTFKQTKSPLTHEQTALLISFLLWAGSILFDPRILRVLPGGFSLGGQQIDQVYLWSGIWVASWVVPLLAAVIVTQRTFANLPQSLFRNLLNYWLLMLFLLLVSGILNSVSQQPEWQQVSVMVAILAALVGSYTVTRSQLPDLPLAARQLASRLAGSLIIFGFSLLALSYLVQVIVTLPPDVSVAGRNLVFILAAALFSVAFTVFYRVVTNTTRRIFLPAVARRQTIMSEYANAIGNLPEPDQLGYLFLRMVQSNFATDDAWFFEAADGPQGRLILRPLASVGKKMPVQAVDFEHTDPITRTLRRQKAPMVQYDVDTLESFADVPNRTRDILAEWQRILYMPLHAGDSLIGVLALGEKQSGESYSRVDFQNLQQMGAQISPLLAQAQNLASLQKITRYVFRQNRNLARDKRHLKELMALYGQFVDLISPELTAPFAKASNLTRELEAVHQSTEPQPALLDALEEQLDELKRPLSNLVSLANRIGSRKLFEFTAVQMNDVLDAAIRKLSKMSTARRVKIEFDPDPTLPPVLGDYEQLLEAVLHLLHNAIKFNKIGGVVQLTCKVESSELQLSIIDTGVGISEKRMENLWHSLSVQKQNGSGRGGGFGLAITHFIISAHDGRIDVSSQYGSGTVFVVHLPLYFDESE